MGQTLTIKKGNFVLMTTERNNLVECKSTYDGLVFNFIQGFFLSYTDPYMQAVTKEIITTTLSAFPTANLVVDVSNSRVPVSAKID